MALTIKKPKKKTKKNPYRLSSDRQPGIAKANKGKRKRSIRDILKDLEKRGLGPFKPGTPRKRFPKMEPQPYRPKRFDEKDVRRYMELLKAKPKSGQAKPAVTKKRGGGIAKRGMGKAK